MIERWLKNDLSKKRWRRFKRNKPAMVSIFILAFLFFLLLHSRDLVQQQTYST